MLKICYKFPVQFQGQITMLHKLYKPVSKDVFACALLILKYDLNSIFKQTLILEVYWKRVILRASFTVRT